MTTIVISSSLRMAIIVILKDFEKPICNDHYINLYKQNKLSLQTKQIDNYIHFYPGEQLEIFKECRSKSMLKPS